MHRILLIGLLFVTTLPGQAMPVLSGFEANLEVSSSLATGRNVTVVSLVSGGIFGPGGIAHGLFDLDGAGDQPAQDVLWLVQNLAGDIPPDDNVTISFTFDDTGNFLGIQPTPFFDPNAVAGIEPTPFRIFLGEYPPDPITPSILGELDFRNISGVGIGSLTGISGLKLVNRTGGGPDLTFAPFTISAVPEPSIWLLLVLGFAILSLFRIPGSNPKVRIEQLAVTR